MSTCSISRPHSVPNFVGGDWTGKPLTQAFTHDPPNPHSYDVKLPPELWLKIFDSLCYIPGVFEISDGRAIEAYSEDDQGIILHSVYHESMREKLVISLVSRTWRRIILPLLFEYVMIRSAQHARTVANALACFKHRQSEDEYYGRWIKRVEIVLQDHYWEQDCINAVASVLSHSPNVLVFSDFFSVGRLPSYATRIVLRMLHSLCENGRLRRIESCGAIVSRLHRLLSVTPSLEVLITKQVSSRPISLPNLHTLVIGKTDTVFACELENLQVTNLRNLFMHTSALDPLPACCATRVTSIFPSLRHLRCLRIHEKLSLFHITDLPGLIELTLDFGRRPIFEDLEKFRIKHQTLERVELIRFPVFNPGARLSCGVAEQLFVAGFLQSLLKKENNPALRTIGFLRPRSYFDRGDFVKRPISQERVSDYGFWETFLASCRDQGVRVEASVGVNDHFWGIWEPFHLGLLPQKQLR